MFHRLLPRVVLLFVATLGVGLLAGCALPSTAPAATPTPSSAPAAQPDAQPDAQPATAVVNQNANVRTGPSTDHSVAYWLIAGDTVAIVGASADGDWLQIEHQDRPGWISTRLVDFETAASASAAAPEPDPDPKPQEPEPASDPTPEPEAPTTATVTGGPISVRVGPGTDYASDGLVDDGQTVRIVGRNADATWLQIMHPVATGELVWISQAYADLDVADIDRIRVVAAPPPPAPTEPVAVVIDDCTQWHTVNPNEEYLIDITTWYDLDLRAVARLNRIDPEIPLAVAEVCLLAPGIDTTPRDGHTPNAAPGPLSVTVTGTTVNLRTGPGTEHPTDGQVRAGDTLQATGRNAAGDWLLIVHPAATAEQVWIYAPLTDISAASLQTLATVSAVAIGTPPAQESAVPTPEPAPAPPLAAPTVPADCTRLHTVNPNETRLQQITDWFDLDLAATAELNGLAPDTPLTAGWQICLPEAGAAPPTAVERAPQPAPASQPVAGGPCQTPLGSRSCIPLPDFPDRGQPNSPIGQKVVDSPYDVLWHAPGTYERDLPGLDYDFELVFSDHSIQWDWRLRDSNACYDALRVHMGGVPQEVGLQRMEFRLADPLSFADYRQAALAGMWVGAGTYDSPWTAPTAIPWTAYPDWDPAAMPHPDLAVVKYGCVAQPAGRMLCDIMPTWGNSHSLHLHAVAALAMANSVAYLSDNALASKYNRMSDRVFQADSYLFPMIDNQRGDPAGHGPCAALWRAG